MYIKKWERWKARDFHERNWLTKDYNKKEGSQDHAVLKTAFYDLLYWRFTFLFFDDFANFFESLIHFFNTHPLPGSFPSYLNNLRYQFQHTPNQIIEHYDPVPIIPPLTGPSFLRYTPRPQSQTTTTPSPSSVQRISIYLFGHGPTIY